MLYSIYYPILNIHQYKLLIPHSDYINVKNIDDDKEYYRQYKLLGNGEEWFTENSPWFIAISSGRFVCNNVDIPCIVKPI